MVSASALFVMAAGLAIGLRARVRARMLQSFGLAFLFIRSTWRRLLCAREKTNMARGSLTWRNIGASVGIATVTTCWTGARSFTNPDDGGVNDYSRAYHNMLNACSKLVAAGSTVAHASAQAHGMIYNTCNGRR